MYQSLAKIAPSCATTGPCTRATTSRFGKPGTKPGAARFCEPVWPMRRSITASLRWLRRSMRALRRQASPPASIARTSTPAARRRGA